MAAEEVTCDLCGLADSEVDWTTDQVCRLIAEPGRDPTVEPNMVGADALRICSICDLGRKASGLGQPSMPKALSQVRLAENREQLKVHEGTRAKFESRP